MTQEELDKQFIKLRLDSYTRVELFNIINQHVKEVIGEKEKRQLEKDVHAPNVSCTCAFGNLIRNQLKIEQEKRAGL